MVKEEKIREVEKIMEKIGGYRALCLVDMFKLPSKQLQEIRKKIREKAEMKIIKKSLLKLAIRNLKKEGMEELEKIIPQQPAIILTNANPFKFYSMVDNLKSSVFAKEGDIAQNDIKISAGPTNLLPGPVISELTKAGIPVGVEEGKIAVKKDVVVAKKGDRISKELASALRKLGVEAIEVGLNIVAIYEDGKIYSKETLELVNVYPERIKEAFNQALNLSINISYPTKDSIRHLLIKAYQTAKCLEKIGGAK